MFLSLLLLAANPVQPAPAPVALSPTDEAAAFRAAGFKRVGGQWQGCGDPGTASYTPGAVEQAGDFNGDGRPDALLTEGSTFCFGMTGMGYALVSKQADGRWRVLDQGPGIPHLLTTKGAGGWPDMEIGGPGFCFPVLRWNGTSYAVHRHQYERRPCKPAR